MVSQVSSAPDLYDSRADSFIAHLHNIDCPKQQSEASIRKAVLNDGWDNI